ncbi:MAG: FkbM family methyltransferase [Deltaproteobacteria bacterium]|nr:MAG: FkbM family methyltransferase [Deltaproteobacteria bacterium]
MAPTLLARAKNKALFYVKTNLWVRKQLHKMLENISATRPLADFPLTITFPASQHFNLFFTKKIRYEADSIERLQRYLQPGSVCFDIGANIGIYSIIAGYLVGSEGEVHSFEPDPQDHPWLEFNMGSNNLPQVTVHKHAVGAEPGSVPFYQDVANSRTGSLVEGAWSPEKDDTKVIHVDVLPLDHYINDISRLDFMKIDVETFEYEVLLGAQGLLEKFQPVILIELSDRHRQESLALLHKLGYARQTSGSADEEFMMLFLPSLNS